MYPSNENKPIRPKVCVGDRVRITKKNTVVDKGFMPRWTEVFTIAIIQYADPPAYKIKDDSTEEIQCTFYEQELQRASQEVFRIKKVITTRCDKSLAKWLGYPDPANSWVDNKELVQLH